MSALSKYSKFCPEVVAVEVPEWDKEVVYLKGMDAAGMEAFFKVNASAGEEYSAERSAHIILLHMCDSEGNPLVPEDERDEAVKELAGHKFSVISRLLAESMKVSGLSQDEIEDASKN